MKFSCIGALLALVCVAACDGSGSKKKPGTETQPIPLTQTCDATASLELTEPQQACYEAARDELTDDTAGYLRLGGELLYRCEFSPKDVNHLLCGELSQ